MTEHTEKTEHTERRISGMLQVFLISPLPILLSVCSVFSVCSVISLSFAQSRQSQPSVRIETELVQVDVVVVDQQGKLVKSLKREDFVLYEDGKPQSISYFSIGSAGRKSAVVSEATSRKSTAEVVKSVPVELDLSRHLVLVVDDLHLSPANLLQTKQALLRFIDRQLSDEDRVAFAPTSGTLGLYQQFTNDRDALRRAVNRLSVRERMISGNYEIPRITPYQAELIEQGDPDALEIAVQELIKRFSGGDNSLQERAMAVRDVQTRARRILAENVSVTIATLSAIEGVIRSLKPLPGRKVIALLSDGFLLGGSREGRTFDVRRIVDAATRAGVVIYSIDTRGLAAVTPAGDLSMGNSDPVQMIGIRHRIENSAMEAQRDGIFSLARDTGGLALFNNNDITQSLQRVLDDTESYYLLAFEPVSSYRNGQFRKLEVRLPNHPELKIRSRKGYFAPDEKTLAQEKAKQSELAVLKSPDKLIKELQETRTKQVNEGLRSLFPLRGIPIEMTANFINTAEDGSAADVAAHIDPVTIKFFQTDARFQAKLEIVWVALDENGKLIQTYEDKVELNLKPSSLKATYRSGVNYRRLIPLKPGFYQMRVMVRQEGEAHLGSASSWIEIPDLGKKQLALSSIFLSAQSAQNEPTDESGAPVATQKTAAVFERKGVRMPTKVYRRFKNDAVLNYLIFAYHAKIEDKGKADLAIESQILSGGKLVFASPVIGFGRSPELEGGDPMRIPYLAAAPLQTYAPGKYELRVVVIDRSARTSAKRSINFTIE